MKRKYLLIELDENIYNKLLALAKKANVSEMDLVEAIISHYIMRCER